MPTAFPKMRPPNMAALPPLKVQILSDDPHGIYKCFTMPGHRTLVTRMVADWQEVPDQADVVVETSEGKLLSGRHNRANFLAWGEFVLQNEAQPDQTAYAECVQGVYEPVALVVGEAFVVQPVVA